MSTSGTGAERDSLYIRDKAVRYSTARALIQKIHEVPASDFATIQKYVELFKEVTVPPVQPEEASQGC